MFIGKPLPMIDVNKNNLQFIMVNTDENFLIYKNNKELTTFPVGKEDYINKDSIQLQDINIGTILDVYV